MIRKLIAYNLLVIVLLCTFQVGITTHYCCGNLIGSKLILGEGKVSCGMKPEETIRCDHQASFDRGCCEDFQVKFQFPDDLRSLSFLIAERVVLFDMLPVEIVQLATVQVAPRVVLEVPINSPPDLAVVRESLSILQVFRI